MASQSGLAASGRADCIMTLNAGSSSLKFAVFSRDGLAPLGGGQVEGIGTKPRFSARLTSGAAHEAAGAPGSGHPEALRLVLDWLEQHGIGATRVSAVAHRIVHGGALAIRPMRVDPANLEALETLRALAPLHNAFGLGAVRSVLARMPDVPQIACFDTAFHATQPDEAVRLALPQSFFEEGYRRYGFHGLNYEHVVAELPRVSGSPLPARLLVFHLGNGSSICAVREGRSVATTMGYSTLDGLIMGTRTGSIDPGVLIALQRDKGLSVDALEDLLYRKSGLLGLSGATSDMRMLLASGDAAAQRAVAHFCYWAARHAASLLAALGGLDALVFTGGIGANAAPVRAGILAHLEWLGLRLDGAANARNAPMIAQADSAASLWIVPANEELAMARHAVAMLG